MQNTWIPLAFGVLGFTIISVHSLVAPSPKDIYHNTTGRLHNSRQIITIKKDHHSKALPKYFKPNQKRCCRIGNKVARRKLSCSIHIHIMAKENNISHIGNPYRRKRRYSGKLFPKISRCAAKYTSNFEKCCRNRMEFFKQMKLCKKLKAAERKRCRKEFSLKYS